MAYPGGKGGDGVFQRIICQMPPHELYIEPFLGGGAIMRHKRPAARSIGCDMLASPRSVMVKMAGGAFHRTCGMWFLEQHRFQGGELVYCDPPYPMATRLSGKRFYQHEFSDQDHKRLLAILLALPCLALVSTYRNELYDQALKNWRLVEFQAATRGRPAIEALYCNFPEPTSLHDYRYLGEGWRERERIKKKAKRWQANFAGLPRLERLAVLSALLDPATANMAMGESDRSGNEEGTRL